MYLTFLQQFGMALGLSILIGFEREKSKKENYKGFAFAGVRTFSLIGLLGALSVFSSKVYPVLSILIVCVVFALIVVAYIMTAAKNGRVGLTTEVAAVVTFLIGGISAYGESLIAVTLALVTLMILYFKVPIQKFALDLEKKEIISTIKFMIIAFVVLPLLPNQWMGPFGIFNPYVIWLMVVFVSGISFASYVIIKLLGPRKGIGVTGFLGGLISSTALSLDFSKQSKEHKNIVNPYVFAVVIAAVASLVRILFVVFVLNKEFLYKLAVPFSVMAFVGFLFAIGFLFWKDKGRSRLGKGKVERFYKAKSPFRLIPALKFGALFAVVLFLTKFGQVYFGSQGIYAVGFVSGVLDIDAITISLSNLVKADQFSLYVTAITLAVAANSLFKLGLFWALGSKKVALKLTVVFTVMVGCGLASLMFV